MVKSKKDKLKKEKDDVRKEFEKLMFDNPDVSQELFDTIIELFNENTAFRKKFGLEPVDTSKTPPATIDNPIYSGIVDQLLQGKKITKALECVGESLSKTDVAIVKQWKCFKAKKTKDVKKSIRQVKRFYYHTAGGKNEENIQKTFKTIQKLINKNKK